MSEWHPLALTAMILVGLAVPMILGMAVIRLLREKPQSQRPESMPPPAVGTMTTAITTTTPAEEIRCPCGAKATKPRPKYRVWEIPVVGRVLTRQKDAFGEPEVCDAHAEVANAVIDERLAMAKLAEARSERDRITALANSNDVLAEIVSSLPEDRQRAYKRSLQPTPVVRVLRVANGEDSSGNGNSGTDA
jgi:hypothetical protein